MSAKPTLNSISHAALFERIRNNQSVLPRPFLRWAGSKRSLLMDIVPKLPASFQRYWEPFLGGGSLFFLVQPRQAHLSDACGPLIETYSAVAHDPESVIRALARFGRGPTEYYRIRAMRPRSYTGRAARFIYLNKMGWNGLYRVNGRGEFNVPYGRPKSDRVVDAEHLRAVAAAVKSSVASLTSSDFDSALDGVGGNDLVFLDPPYVTGHNNNGFVDYNRHLFSWEDQRRLARTAQRLRARGAYVMVTNADHRDVLDLYPDFEYRQLHRSSTLASDSSKRRVVQEALLVGQP
jgi:DNA adenine methylase